MFTKHKQYICIEDKYEKITKNKVSVVYLYVFTEIYSTISFMTNTKYIFRQSNK